MLAACPFSVNMKLTDDQYLLARVLELTSVSAMNNQRSTMSPTSEKSIYRALDMLTTEEKNISLAVFFFLKW